MHGVIWLIRLTSQRRDKCIAVDLVAYIETDK
nr:MAG TPA: hypothetical protein [Caudoviricetes sp.]